MNRVSVPKTLAVALLAATTILNTYPRPARASWYGDLYNRAVSWVETGADAVARGATAVYRAAGTVVREVLVPAAQAVADAVSRTGRAIRDGAEAVATWAIRHRHLLLGTAAIACSMTGVGAGWCIAGAAAAFVAEDVVTRAVEGQAILDREGIMSIGLHATEGLLWSLPAVGEVLHLAARIGPNWALIVEGGLMLAGFDVLEQVSSGGPYDAWDTLGAAAMGAATGPFLQLVLPPLGQACKTLLKRASVSVAVRTMVRSFRSEIDPAFREIARRAGVRTAWRLEQKALLEGRATLFTDSLTNAEREALASEGRLPGYQGHHVCSVAVCPGLAADPDNIVLIRRAVHEAIHAGGRLTMGPLKIPDVLQP